MTQQTKLFSHEVRDGQPQLEILDVAYRTEDLVQPGRRASVLAQLERTRPDVVRRVAAVMTQRPKIRVAWLLPSPVTEDPLPGAGLDSREVELTIERSTYRDRFEFRVFPAARLEDLGRALHQWGAQVVHFSGHGLEDGSLLFEGEGRDRVPVNAAALRESFDAARGQVRCVVLAACYSAQLSDALLPAVDCVLGTEQALNDDSAVGFANGFYLALTEGKSLAAAYSAGLAHVLVGESDTSRQPTIRTRNGFDAEASLVGIA